LRCHFITARQYKAIYALDSSRWPKYEEVQGFLKEIPLPKTKACSCSKGHRVVHPADIVFCEFARSQKKGNETSKLFEEFPKTEKWSKGTDFRQGIRTLLLRFECDEVGISSGKKAEVVQLSLLNNLATVDSPFHQHIIVAYQTTKSKKLPEFQQNIDKIRKELTSLSVSPFIPTVPCNRHLQHPTEEELQDMREIAREENAVKKLKEDVISGGLLPFSERAAFTQMAKGLDDLCDGCTKYQVSISFNINSRLLKLVIRSVCLQ